MTQALEGVTVVDLSRHLPGPFASMILARHGARVVQVENPDAGDQARQLIDTLPGVAVLLETVNRGKERLTLNLKKEEGRAVLNRLLEKADVLVDSFRPGVLESWNLDYPQLSRRLPRLIHCSVTGFGRASDESRRPGHDLNFAGRAGLLQPLSGGDGTPLPPPTPVSDFVGGMSAALGVLLALRERDQTGRGRSVDISITHSLATLLVPAALQNSCELGTSWLTGGLACYGVYRTSDQRFISLGALEPKFWRNLCRVMGREELGGDHLNPARQETLRREVAAAVSARSLEEWLELAHTEDLCLEAVRTPAQAAAELFGSVSCPDPVSYRAVPADGAAPGRDTGTILRNDLGLSREEIERLQAQGVV